MVNDSTFDPVLVDQNTLVFIDGGSLRAYDLLKRTGPVSLTALEPGECCLWHAGADADGTYLVVSGVNWSTNTGKPGARLLRMTTSAVEVLAVEPLRKIGDVFATPTRVIYSVGFPFEADFAYRSVPRSGGNPTTLLTLVGCNHPQTVVDGEQLWYACQSSATRDVVVIRSDGMERQVIDNATIVSGTRKNPLPLRRTNTSTNYSVILARNLPTDPSALSGAQLQAFEVATRVPLVTYGNLPPNAFKRAFGLDGLFQPIVGLPGQSLWGLPSLLGAESTVSSVAAPLVGRDADIFFYQSEKAGITRATTFVQ